MSAGDSFSHLAKIMSYRPKVGSDLAMMWAYFDETMLNEDENPDGKRKPVHMLVGGCIASTEQWGETFGELAACSR